MLAFVFILGFTGRVGQDESGRVVVLSIYWHFVDGVCVVVCTVVYLLGR